jgi:GTPase SAR1 family protein
VWRIGVGKTSIVGRYVTGIFDPTEPNTIGASFQTKAMYGNTRIYDSHRHSLAPGNMNAESSYLFDFAGFFVFFDSVVGDKVTKLQIWDTAGQERFRSLAPMYYRGASAAVLVVDFTQKRSFESIRGWVDELRANVHTDMGEFHIRRDIFMSTTHSFILNFSQLA